MSILGTFSGASIRGFQNPDVVQGLTPLAILVSPSPTSNGNFGWSVDINDDGSRLIIGQPGGGGLSGYAYIFVQSGSTWVLEATLGGIATNDAFGFDVAISGNGNYALVGAPDVGRAYFYSRSGSSWSLTNNFGPLIGFGTSVDLNDDGTYAVVGNPKYVSITSNEGRISIYNRTTSWALQQEITNTDTSNLGFGYSVSINDNGDRILIGFNDTLTGSPGQRPKYTSRTGSTWTAWASLGTLATQSQIVGPMNVVISKDGNYYAYCSNTSGNTFIYTGTGTPSFQTSLSDFGSLSYDDTGAKLLIGEAYYTRSGTTWTFQQNYKQGSTSISADGIYKCFGVPSAIVNGFSDAGAVYIY